MFSFIKNSVFGLISVGCRLFSSLILNKVVASYFGPAGLVQMAHFLNLISFFTLIPNDGINRGIMPYLTRNESNAQEFYRYIKSGFGLTCFVFGLTTLLILCGRKWFLIYLPTDSFWLILFLSGAFLVVILSFFNAVLLARKRIYVVLVGNCLTALLVILYVLLAYRALALSSFLIGYLLILSSIVLYTLPFSLQNLSLSGLVNANLSLGIRVKKDMRFRKCAI